MSIRFIFKKILEELFSSEKPNSNAACRCILQDFEKQQDIGSFFGFEFFTIHNYEKTRCASCGIS